MDSGNKFNCVEWFLWWILPMFIYSGCSRKCLPDLQDSESFCCLLYLGCTSSATFFAWSCWVEVAKSKGPSLGSLSLEAPASFEMLSINGINLRWAAVSWTGGILFKRTSQILIIFIFQLLLAPDSFSLYPENDVSYSIWGKCICPGSKFAVRYALCWSLAERHIWWLSNFDPTQKETQWNCGTFHHGYQTTHVWFWKFLQGRGEHAFQFFDILQPSTNFILSLPHNLTIHWKLQNLVILNNASQI